MLDGPPCTACLASCLCMQVYSFEFSELECFLLKHFSAFTATCDVTDSSNKLITDVLLACLKWMMFLEVEWYTDQLPHYSAACKLILLLILLAQPSSAN